MSPVRSRTSILVESSSRRVLCKRSCTSTNSPLILACPCNARFRSLSKAWFFSCALSSSWWRFSTCVFDKFSLSSLSFSFLFTWKSWFSTSERRFCASTKAALVSSDSLRSIWLSRSKESFWARKEATTPEASDCSPAFWRRIVSSWARFSSSKITSSFPFNFLSRWFTWVCSCSFELTAYRNCLSSCEILSLRSSRSFLRRSTSVSSSVDSSRLSVSTTIEASICCEDSKWAMRSLAWNSWSCCSWHFSSFILMWMLSSAIFCFNDIFSSSRRLALSRLLSLLLSIRMIFSFVDW